jgi:hypothetical protein
MMTKKKRKASKSVVTPPDRLLEEAARDFDSAESRQDRRLALLAEAMRVFQGHMGDTPGAADHHASIRWDDEGEGVYVIQQLDGGVHVATANPSGAWALYLDASVLPLVVDAAQKAMREESDRQERAIEEANALLEDAAQDRQGVV